MSFLRKEPCGRSRFCHRRCSDRQLWHTYFSLSPCHLETRSEEETLKNVESASVATAFARYDFPVPGGCPHNDGIHSARTIQVKTTPNKPA